MKKCEKIKGPELSVYQNVWRSSLNGHHICFIFADLRWRNFFGENWSDTGLELEGKGKIIGD